jgi:hypothetical protein
MTVQLPLKVDVQIEVLCAEVKDVGRAGEWGKCNESMLRKLR